MSDKILKLSQAQTLYQDLRGRIDVLPTNEDIPEVPVQDVQVNGTSVLENGVANVPVATNARNLGVVKVGSTSGTGIGATNYGELYVDKASTAQVKAGTNQYNVIVPYNMQDAAFYGLAKAAGADMKDSSNPVGTYPDAQKAAIQNMLGITDLISTEESSTATTAHALNSTFMMNGKLHRATAAITIGDAVEVGTNCEVVKADEVFVKNTDIANNNNFGVVKGNPEQGVGVYNSGTLYISGPSSILLKAGVNTMKPITVAMQHESTFYGLAKAAGADEKDSTLPVGQYTDTAKSAIKSMLGITQTITVTVLTQDNVTVTGQIVTVRAVDATGPIFATAAYEGQPVTFAVPSGFAYHVSVSDTLEHHFNPTTASGIITNTDVAITLQYSDFSTIRTAVDIKAALNAGMDLTDLVGEQITCAKGDDTLSWDVVDYDSTNGSIMLLLHNAFGTANMVFEPAQALMWCENGLAAGSYTFADGDTHYYFTTSTALPAGGQLRATDTTYYLYASQASTGTLETGTVSTTEIAGATDLGTCAQGLLNHFSRNRYGGNNIAESAIQWWLNSNEAANVQRPFITKFQRPQSYNVPGFMNGLDQEFIDCLDEVDWKCSTNNVYECPKSLGGLTDGTGRAYTIKAKFCLASEMEIFGSYGGNPDGSTVFDLYNGADADDMKKYRGTAAQYWWLRSPYWSNAYSERRVYSSGGASNNHANGSYAVVPACQISRDQEAGA